jgi:peroxiredoxin
VGASFDSWSENQAFAEENELQFELWSDPNRELALHFGAADSDSDLFADRETMVLDEQGRLCLVYRDVMTDPHPAEVLADVTLLLAP